MEGSIIQSDYTIDHIGKIKLTGTVSPIICKSCENVLGQRNDTSILSYTKIALFSDNKATLRCGGCGKYTSYSIKDGERITL